MGEITAVPHILPEQREKGGDTDRAVMLLKVLVLGMFPKSFVDSVNLGSIFQSYQLSLLSVTAVVFNN